MLYQKTLFIHALNVLPTPLVNEFLTLAGFFSVMIFITDQLFSIIKDTIENTLITVPFVWSDFLININIEINIDRMTLK